MKQCGDCLEWKLESEFYPGRRCKICHQKRTAVWMRKNPEKARAIRRRISLKSKYGLTVEEWEKIFHSQLGKCGICGKEGKKLFVDHDHETGKIRGLLCNSCNMILGRFGDNIPGLERALDYLKENHA